MASFAERGLAFIEISALAAMVKAMNRQRLAAILLLASVLGGCATTPDEHLASAKAHLAAHDYSAARTELVAGLHDQPSDKAMLQLFAHTLLRLNDGEGAGIAIDRYAAAGGSAAEVNQMRAEVQLIKGDPQAAWGMIETDQSSEGMRLGAQALAALGQTRESITRFEQGLTQVPSAPLITAYARLRLSANDAEGAGRLSAMLSQLAPNSYEAMMIAADLAAIEARISTALAGFARAAKAFPSRPEPLLAAADVLERTGQTKEAAAMVAKAAELAPGLRDVGAMSLRVTAAAGQWDKVLVMLQPLETQIVPASPDGLLYAEAMLRQGRPEQARAMLTQVLTQEPNNPQARRLTAEAQLATGDPNRAFATVQPLVETRFPERSILELAIRIGDAAGEPEAEALAAKLASPEYALYERHAVAADKAAMLGDWSAAATHYRELVALDTSAQTLGNLAWATMMAGDPTAAIGLADRASALSPEDPMLLHNAAYARYRAGRDLAQARTLLQRAAALDPANLEIRVRLITVEAATG